jgi:hypothetical protein
MATRYYTKGNTHLNMFTKQLHIYNGLVTSPVVKQTILQGRYAASTTQNGNTYITVPPTLFDPNWKPKIDLRISEELRK